MLTSKAQDPDGWQWVRLGDVAEVNPRRPRLNVTDNTPVRFLPMAAVGGQLSGVIESESRPYSEISSGYTYFEENDAIFAKITPCLQNGKHALVKDLPNGFGFGSTEFHVVRAGELLDPRHLFRALTQPENIRECTNSFTGTAGQQRVQPDVLKFLPILLPPLPEQRAIAAVLDAIDEAIERTEAVIAATERLRDALLHELLTRGVPGWHSEWKEAPGIGTIPSCWEVVRLGEVLASTTYGTNASLDGSGSTPVLRMGNLQNGQIDLSEVRRANLTDRDLQKLNLVNGDILFNRTNSLDLVGKVAIVHDLPQPISFASYLVRLRIHKKRADPFWLAALLWSSSCQARIHQFATPGVSQANINPTSLKSLMIPLPSLLEQRAIAAALHGVESSLTLARNETNALKSLQASTADALLTGRVRVKIS